MGRRMSLKKEDEGAEGCGRKLRNSPDQVWGQEVNSGFKALGGRQLGDMVCMEQRQAQP